MKPILKLIGIFILGVILGNTFFQYKAKPEIKRDILPISGIHYIILEQKNKENTISMSYETFEYIVKHKKQKDILNRLTALFYRMDDNNIPLNAKKINLPKFNSTIKDTPSFGCNWENCGMRE